VVAINLKSFHVADAKLIFFVILEKEFLEFPSGGDTSYPGMVFYDGILWVSYYSSHEEKTSIYLAKVKID